MQPLHQQLTSAISTLNNAQGINLKPMSALMQPIHSYSHHLQTNQHSIQPSDRLAGQLTQPQMAYIQDLINKYVRSAQKLLNAIGASQENNLQMEMTDMESSHSQTDQQTQQKEMSVKIEHHSNGASTNTNALSHYGTPYPLLRNKLAFAQSFARKKKAALSEQQIQSLELDLKSPNLNKQQIQKKYDISESTLNRYVRRFRQWQQQMQRQIADHSKYPVVKSGVLGERQGRRGSKVRLVQEKVIEIYKKYPNIYQSQVASMLSQEFKMDISIHVVSRCLKNIHARESTNQQLKKPQPQQQNDAKNIQARFIFAKEFLKRKPNNCIFVDEAFIKNRRQANTSDCKQEQVWDKVHFAIALDGQGKIVHYLAKSDIFKVPQILQFITHLTTQLAPFTLVLDTARIHTQERVKQFTKAKGIDVLYLPNCSPQLNPVQAVLGTFIRQFRKRVSQNNQVEQVLRIASQSLEEFKSIDHCRQVGAAKKFLEMAVQKLPLPLPIR